MAVATSLGERMKGYEGVTRTYLMRRTPAIIRVDGKAFHSFTRGFEMFDDILSETMEQTMQYLCEHIQGCVLGYKQSDEISLVLTDYATIKTDAWFGYNIQKMSSIAASMATLAFNRGFEKNVISKILETESSSQPDKDARIEQIKKVYVRKFHQALFDARAFSVPKDEVCNYLIWRQQDATRNSIETVGRTMFGHARMKHVSCNKIQDLLFTEKEINWNNYPTVYKRGCCCIKVETSVPVKKPSIPEVEEFVNRMKWKIDREIPIFSNQRQYIEDLL